MGLSTARPRSPSRPVPGGRPVRRPDGPPSHRPGVAPVRRAGARSRRSGRSRRPCGRRGRGSWGSRSCRSRVADRRPGAAAGAAHRRLARRERGARRVAARECGWTSCPVRTFPGRSAGRCGLGPCDEWSPGDCWGLGDRVAARRGERGFGCSYPAQASPEQRQGWGRPPDLSNAVDARGNGVNARGSWPEQAGHALRADDRRARPGWDRSSDVG